MTYCLGIITKYGLLMASDSRTNAGVDHVSTYLKLFDFSCPGERVILLSCSGNLSITQSVINELRRDIQAGEVENLHSLHSLYEIARYIGAITRRVQERDRPWLEKDGIDCACNFLLGGQIHGQEPELMLIYSQGNFICATPETPFLQIGETKYGKPILDRTLTFDTSLDVAAKCALLSIDSTMKSNISVGPPIRIVLYERNSLKISHQLEFRIGDPYLMEVRRLWEECLKQGFANIPDIDWQQHSHQNPTNGLID